MTNLLIYWFSNGTPKTRKFLRREVIQNDKSNEGYLVAWMTEGAIWKHYAMRRVSKSDWEEELRNPPAFAREET